ncbi:hypothetical protein B0J17DRAFT_287643 [Rhizoctonia solani]|nr:hypothetical protein B0J17DRAFT_287643 [Rhizoctonia solani]
MGDVVGLALGASVTCSAPASRPLASSSNGSSQMSSTHRTQLPIILDFHSDDGKEAIRSWYRQQPTTRFTSLEYRKVIDGLFRHEFVVVHLDNSTVCRLDRRAREDLRGYALRGEGTVSEDSAHVVSLADTEHKAYLDRSEVLLGMDLPEGQDLNFILTACYAIQCHPKAKSYNLLYYNCYFFSWTLVTCVTRRASNWEAVVGSNQLRDTITEVITIEYFLGLRLSKLSNNSQMTRPARSTTIISSFIHKFWSIDSGSYPEHQAAPVPTELAEIMTHQVHDISTPSSRQGANEKGHDNITTSEHPMGIASSGEKNSLKRWEALADMAEERISSRGKHVHTKIQRELQLHFPSMLSHSLEMLLLNSRLSVALRGCVYSALSKISEVVATHVAVAAALRSVDHISKLGFGAIYTNQIRDLVKSVASLAASRANQSMVDFLRGGTDTGHVSTSGDGKSNIEYHLGLQAGEKEWDNAWDNAWAPRYSTRSFLYYPNGLFDRCSPAGKDAWRKAWMVSSALSYDECIQETISTKLAGVLIGYLTDPEFIVHLDSIGADESKGKLYTNPQRGRNPTLTNSQKSFPQSLQSHIRARMTAHFEQVESYGFGEANELVDRAEDTMCMIWESVTRMMKDESTLLFL